VPLIPDTVIGQLEALDRGEVTSKELIEQCLRRIEHSQPTLNAFRVIAADDARQAAAAADDARTRGDSKPLLGVPIAIKDDIDLAGHPTAFGVSGTFPPATDDSELVRRIKASGAVIVGKTHSSEFGQYPLTGTNRTGYTRNPWGRDFTPGGSSGGASAAVAAALVPAAIGSDGAGSVRIPASWTNLVGVKPQRGRLSTWPWPAAFHGITVNGPLTHTVADAALLIDVLQGNVPGERYLPPRIDLADAASTDPGRLRIGLSIRPPVTIIRSHLHPRLRSAVFETGELLTRLGHRIVRREPGYDFTMGLGFLVRSMSGFPDWRKRMPDAQLDHRTLDAIRNGRITRPLLPLAPHAERITSALVRRAFANDGGVDVIIAPTTAQPPLRVDAIDEKSTAKTDQIITSACPYTWPWNWLGWPAVSIPAGFTDDGLPVGVQLMGKPNSEPLLLSLAAQLEAELRWYDTKPDPWW